MVDDFFSVPQPSPAEQIQERLLPGIIEDIKNANAYNASQLLQLIYSEALRSESVGENPYYSYNLRRFEPFIQYEMRNPYSSIQRIARHFQNNVREGRELLKTYNTEENKQNVRAQKQILDWVKWSL